jgi:hypothetical protein
MGSTHCCCQPNSGLLKAALPRSMPSPMPSVRLQTRPQIASEKGKFNTLAVNMSLPAHFFHRNRKAFSWSILFSSSELSLAMRRSALYTSVLALVVWQRFSDARDVEQREIHRPLRLQPILCRSSSAAFDTLCRSSGRSQSACPQGRWRNQGQQHCGVSFPISDSSRVLIRRYFSFFTRSQSTAAWYENGGPAPGVIF